MDVAAAIIARLDRANEELSILAKTIAPPIYRLPSQQAIVNAQGFATIAFRVEPGGVVKVWMVERIFVWTNSTAGSPRLIVYVMDGLPLPGTQDNPNQYTAALDPLYGVDTTNLAMAGGDEIAPIPVKGGESIVFQWSGLNQNDKCVAHAQYKLAWQGQGL